VVFGADTQRPTITCISEDALPTGPDSDWLILARDSDFAPREFRFDSAQRKPFDSAQRGPFDSAQGKPFDSARDR
jgi:hypothetical protein